MVRPQPRWRRRLAEAEALLAAARSDDEHARHRAERLTRAQISGDRT